MANKPGMGHEIFKGGERRCCILHIHLIMGEFFPHFPLFSKEGVFRAMAQSSGEGRWAAPFLT
ncbi:hypothetical protein T09_15555 [Trichinella sp. T9]|nr:hypothetical protein T09_15555 [Trichinella sp. T9]